MMTAATTNTRTAVTMRRRVFGFTPEMLRGRYGGGMHELQLFAISINDLRDIFGAEATLAAHLRGIATRSFAPERPQKSALEKIGPLFRRHRPTEIDVTRPQPGDVDALLGGGHVSADRLPQSWRLLIAWLESISAQHQSVILQDFDRIEFDLARAGLPSDFSLRNLAARDLGTPLQPLPGQIVGYSKHSHVVATACHLRLVQAQAAAGFEDTMNAVQPLIAVLDGIESRPEETLDLVVVQAL